MANANTDFASLYKMLSAKSMETNTFGTISAFVQKKFAKDEYLSVGTLLTVLLRCQDLTGKVPRLFALYIIFDLFKSDGQLETPFATFFMNLLDERMPPKISPLERTFLEQLLTGVSNREIAKQSPAHILKQETMPKLNINTKPFVLKTIEEQKHLPITAKATVSNCIPAPEATTPTENDINELINGLCFTDSSPLRNVIAPQFMTIAPPLMPVQDELVWLDPTNRSWHTPIYETSMLKVLPNFNNEKMETTRLGQLAFTQALSFQERQSLQNELNKNPDMVNHIGLTPEKLPGLVENNPLVAIEVLLKLMDSPEITEYFNVLVNMEMSLYSMEVVNRLTTSVDLPTEFVYLYISNCISTCENIKDKFLQTRLVRLLCVFLQSLIRNKMIDVKELFLEVEAFCVEFSRIREATALYRLLKQLEFGDAGPAQPQPSTSGQSK